MHDAAGLNALIAQATADPTVAGLILTGSMATGTGRSWSDYDVRLIVQDDADEDAIQHYAQAAFPMVDLSIMRLSAFAAYAAWGTPDAWDRYTFTHAQVLLDRPGSIRALVEEKGRLPPDQQSAFAAAMLDAFVNNVYRALKCQRRDNLLCVRLEASEAVTHALHLLFAWDGRLKPYPVWLEHDLETAPLSSLPLSGDDLLCLLTRIVADGDVAAMQDLFTMIVRASAERGHGDIVAAWGEDVGWIRSFVPAS